MTLEQAFRDQAVSCTRLGSPFMGQLLNVLAEIWPAQSRLGQKLAAVKGEIGPAGASLPLRVSGGLHALVLCDTAPDLTAVYPPKSVDDATLAKNVLAALAEHEDFLMRWVDSPPQTNEVRRSAALMAAATIVQSHFELPVALSELGASGGLNLMWDRFALQLPGGRLGADPAVVTLAPDWEGPAPAWHLPLVVDRAGVDLNPLNPADPEDLLRLTAYLWPDQPDRIDRTRAAAAVMTASLDRGDAIDWLDGRLAAASDGQVHMIQHTVAWQYFPPAAQARGEALIEAAGAVATPNRPLAWLSMETDGDTTAAIGAALTLRLWPGDITLDLGRADFHGRWIKWNGAA